MIQSKTYRTVLLYAMMPIPTIVQEIPIKWIVPDQLGLGCLY